MTQSEFETHLKEMSRHESVFWAMSGSVDPIAERVEKAIADIETVCRPALDERQVGFILIEPISQLFRKLKDWFLSV
jgi:hypothetical protein